MLTYVFERERVTAQRRVVPFLRGTRDLRMGGKALWVLGMHHRAGDGRLILITRLLPTTKGEVLS